MVVRRRPYGLVQPQRDKTALRWTREIAAVSASAPIMTQRHAQYCPQISARSPWTNGAKLQKKSCNDDRSTHRTLTNRQLHPRNLLHWRSNGPRQSQRTNRSPRKIGDVGLRTSPSKTKTRPPNGEVLFPASTPEHELINKKNEDPVIETTLEYRL